MKPSLDTTVMTAEKIHSFGNNFNKARKFAKANGITTVIVTMEHYWDKQLNLIKSPYSFSYSV